jgi:hypothetical protein
MKTRLEETHLIKAHNESKQGLNLKTARSQQARISETPLFSQPSKQTDLFKKQEDQK